MHKRYSAIGFVGIGLLVGLGIAWSGFALSPRDHSPAAPVTTTATQPSSDRPLALEPITRPRAAQVDEREADTRLQAAGQQQRDDIQAALQQQRKSFATLNQRLDQLFAAQQALREEVDRLGQQAAEHDIEAAEPEAIPEASEEQIVETVIEKHESEAVDNSWRLEAEEAIETSFDHRELPDTVLLGAECRSTMCRIEVAYDGDRLSPEASMQLPYIVPWDTDGLLVYDDTNRSVVFYAAREGMTLDQVTESR